MNGKLDKQIFKSPRGRMAGPMSFVGSGPHSQEFKNFLSRALGADRRVVSLTPVSSAPQTEERR